LQPAGRPHSLCAFSEIAIVVSRRIAVISISLLLLVFLIVYSARSWIRSTVFPWVVSVSVRNSLDGAIRQGVSDIVAADPGANIDTTAGANLTCTLDRADKFYAAALCERLISGDLAPADNQSASLAQVVQTLRARGWVTVDVYDQPIERVIANKSYGPIHCNLVYTVRASRLTTDHPADQVRTLGCYRSISIL
jgi:hypothetical protein